MQILDAAATRHHLGFPALIGALRAMFVAGCEVPQRHMHAIASGDDGVPSGTVLIMPAWRAGHYFGLKTVMIFPGNGARGLPGLHSTYLLYDAATGQPLAQLDGDEITSRRTAAASALAADYLARRDARRLLVVGAGRIATLIPEAMCAVRPIDEVVVWNRTRAGAEQLTAALGEMGIPARVGDDLAACVAEADIVSCATLSNVALIEGRWLTNGTHLDLIGSFTPAMREADAMCFKRARVFVDTAEALVKSGDLLGAIAQGVFTSNDLQGTLADMCAARCIGRRNDEEITLFKAVGTALEDLAAAELVYGYLLGAAGRPASKPL
ncbi:MULTISPECIES: ornithine cyclodeaminase family protein [Rhodanobacter]|uniref:ornithine cyclodeaminase family protein n=1 Tax=Rhodanobacter TaxID=75309 RepID=UPI000413B4CA|nr:MULTISPECIES: ornithine cyclodeaminase family protein [Rhodanobacter]TAN17493.1 MAG: ornithine cyclodeaminase family protein [Rhodanobacter sp.]UJJ56444.1 ornithine cyclodeaminase family protein [Rhodanobacter thiooxydans]